MLFLDKILFLCLKRLDGKEVVSFDEVLLGTVYTQEALINLLVEKGIISRNELIAEIRRVQQKVCKGK